jgi:addiction module HigA family antidote
MPLLPDRQLPIHPGQYLREKFMKRHGLLASSVSAATKIHYGHLKALLDERVSLTAEDGCRLGHYFSTGAFMWLELQQAYDLEKVKQHLGDSLYRAIVPFKPSS